MAEWTIEDVAARFEEAHARTGAERPRIVAHFADETIAAILRAHYAGAEVNVSLAVELVVRSAQDPGSADIHRRILTPEATPSQFSVTVPHGVSVAYGRAFSFFKEDLDAVLIAARCGPAGEVAVNPRKDLAVGGGDVLYYIADQRIRPDDVRWAAIGA